MSLVREAKEAYQKHLAELARERANREEWARNWAQDFFDHMVKGVSIPKLNEEFKTGTYTYPFQIEGLRFMVEWNSRGHWLYMRAGNDWKPIEQLRDIGRLICERNR